MALVRLAWMLSVGLVLATIIYAAAFLCALTIIGLPLAFALFVVGTRVLTLRV
jgi:uncharacterized membrane protein YccF (DUF307 family)